MISEEDKGAYLEAKRLAPELVATESNPMVFFQGEGMNPWSAATRLALYWKFRKDVFQEKWLLPLDLSGRGALTPEDVENIKKHVVILQKWPGEASVALIDFSKAPNQSEHFPSKAAFFVSTILFLDEDLQKNDVFFFHTMAPQFFLRRRKNKGRAFEIVKKAFPVPLRKVFLLARHNSGLSDSIVSTTYSMISLVAEFFTGDPPEFIGNKNVEDAYRKCRRAGLPHHCIPQFLGGSWDLTGISLWDEDLLLTASSSLASSSPSFFMNEEETSPRLLPHQNAATQPPRPEGVSHPDQVPAVKPKRKRGRPPKEMKEESTKDLKASCEGDEEFVKKRNALYSRRLYHKRKKEANEIQGTVDKLLEENRRLQAEGERLENLLAEAQLHVAFQSV